MTELVNILFVIAGACALVMLIVAFYLLGMAIARLFE